MVEKYLGETIDIHGGGHDLQFPHHECEIAQSEALHGKPLARYWMHNGYIHINHEKMSKSLGNSINVRDLLAKHSPEALRFFMLSAHYRSPLNYAEETVRQAEQGVARIANCVRSLEHRLKAAVTNPIIRERDREIVQRIEEAVGRFHEKMQDDFNTPDAVTAVFDLVAEANAYLQHEVTDTATLERFLSALRETGDILGIVPEQREEMLDEDIERLIAERSEARRLKNWKRADEIRDLLLAKGIVLEDTPQGVRWRRK